MNRHAPSPPPMPVFLLPSLSPVGVPATLLASHISTLAPPARAPPSPRPPIVEEAKSHQPLLRSCLCPRVAPRNPHSPPATIRRHPTPPPSSLVLLPRHYRPSPLLTIYGHPPPSHLRRAELLPWLFHAMPPELVMPEVVPLVRPLPPIAANDHMVAIFSKKNTAELSSSTTPPPILTAGPPNLEPLWPLMAISDRPPLTSLEIHHGSHLRVFFKPSPFLFTAHARAAIFLRSSSLMLPTGLHSILCPSLPSMPHRAKPVRRHQESPMAMLVPSQSQSTIRAIH